MQTDTHPNSHIVYVLRARMFSGESRKELEDYFADSYKGVGSYFSKGGMRTATGLTIPEENLLLPDVLNIPQEDRDFRKEVTTWYQNIDTKIPAHKWDNATLKGGKPLEIGLERSNTEPVSEYNMPINVEHYLRYRQIIGHPFVAMNEAEGNGNQLKQFYIFDPEEVSLGNLGINEAKDKALTAYLTIKDKPRTVQQYLTLLGKNTKLIKKGEEAMELRKLAESKPEEFIKVDVDKDKAIKYTIEEMVNYKILERVNQRLLTKDGEEIGRSIKEAVLYLKDTHNSKSFAMLKAQLQEAWKKDSISVDTDEDLEPLDEQPKKSLANLVKEKKAEPATEPAGLEIYQEETTTKDTDPPIGGALADVE